MGGLWQRFVRFLGDDPEAAGIGFLVAVVGIAASIGMVVYCAALGRYGAAVGLATAFSGIAWACRRAYRRGRWSVISGALLAVWLLLTAAVIAYGCWIAYRRG